MTIILALIAGIVIGRAFTVWSRRQMLNSIIREDGGKSWADPLVGYDPDSIGDEHRLHTDGTNK